jgi:hypothetical protein
MTTLPERAATSGDRDAEMGRIPACSESVEPPCDCPPGWQHLPDCPVVTGKPA